MQKPKQRAARSLAQLVRETGGRTVLLVVRGTRPAAIAVVNVVWPWEVQRFDRGSMIRAMRDVDNLSKIRGALLGESSRAFDRP